ncbi:ABC transporter ATP-binding protein [Nocardioides daphniae]|uniref:Tetronasin ABC transporter ATP-binding protein n=1 Tax=Nocardioides daphniae TaxID=402297 RepID=A0ABQ1PZD6_9ACTN|nr:ABC transporter ATP-binding protein [Nocardioides daphniae]GGD07531.1 tetronasin ABC transporter ATP-binding protein [Nocardioides daphniae]
MAAIELSQIVKTFGRVRALDSFDLRVESGEVHGFLGPNGAGKSTAMRVLLGMIRVDSGTARLLGGDPWSQAAELHRRLAYVPGEVALWPNLTGGEVIDLLGRMRGGLDERRRDELIERFELDPTRKARAYSKGNRQKVALVAALAARVELYLFDEPTAGLDPIKEAEFQSCVHEMRAEGATVLLSSHILAEVEALADKVTIIREGRAVQSGTLAALRSHTRTTVVAETTRPAAELASLPGVHHLQAADGRLRMEVDSAELDRVLRSLADLGVVALQAHPPTLEELFLREYGDEVASS